MFCFQMDIGSSINVDFVIIKYYRLINKNNKANTQNKNSYNINNLLPNINIY